MLKCHFCSKMYPEAILKNMVQIIDNKAYIIWICPGCLPIVNNNPNYYQVSEPKSSPKINNI
ncbi:Uncharacterized [Syntrophomonas zehnderi OL-4]|uniref:Uncharacterized n=1 Tax=Syntrophomonas zehnderi OL-4 TaxID=690567 RepID=A0A0E4G954_9FIRM|nr:Uncharacterized [Syntrophomonas zehnderi OL-4]CFX33471.1 Uncharacterized [Syntrophomonas zehnderi OL-4]